MTDIEKLTKELTDKGLLIEAGFVSLRHMAIAKDASAEQVDEMRSAFFAGAQHLFDLVANAMIEKKQDDSPVGYFYM